MKNIVSQRLGGFDLQFYKVTRDDANERLLEEYRTLLDRVYPDDTLIKRITSEGKLVDFLFGGKNSDSSTTSSVCLATIESKLVGVSKIARFESKDCASGSVIVHPEKGRVGIGSLLLSCISHETRELRKPKLRIGTRCEEGRRFLVKFGGEVINHSVTKELLVDKINWQYIDRLCEEVSIKSPDVEIIKSTSLEGDLFQTYIDMKYDFMAELDKFMKEDKLDKEEYRQKLPELERKRQHSTDKRICIFSKESDGTISGYSMASINNSTPDTLWQALTGVAKPYRGKMLGTRLKIEMLKYIKDNHPEIRKISTGTSFENKWMHDINDRIGFEKRSDDYAFMFDVDSLLDKFTRLGYVS
ncbi:MAG TPA: GNAT family N-acetyltransferase [Caldisericia bacterium]|nr:GNAT family N-acetyltransferase [Caldisericia bacterium]HPF48735.1 GNAT family N-acetyltransferase [Caldisericia bacterium]HPI83605.1 GNAT family N-acetyltransferase [Caldisericia bacterium]HPQ93190.1 GNAT family N-acetyltransferase [Caldisericia bacterium]HRV74977.1 GNAT family N-acetyltransferase [Caldisericia bacterium]